MAVAQNLLKIDRMASSGGSEHQHSCPKCGITYKSSSSLKVRQEIKGTGKLCVIVPFFGLFLPQPMPGFAGLKLSWTKEYKKYCFSESCSSLQRNKVFQTWQNNYNYIEKRFPGKKKDWNQTKKIKINKILLLY